VLLGSGDVPVERAAGRRLRQRGQRRQTAPLQHRGRLHAARDVGGIQGGGLGLGCSGAHWIRGSGARVGFLGARWWANRTGMDGTGAWWASRTRGRTARALG
jgi:hypothetical protein